MNKTILSLGVASLALGVIVFSPSISQAYRADISIKGPNFTAERHEAMEKAFESKDFNVWQQLREGRGRVMQLINKDNFAKFAEIHKLMEDGQTEEAKILRAELGLGLHNGMGREQGNGAENHPGRAMGMGRNS